MMNPNEFYGTLLGLTSPWRVIAVDVDQAKREVSIRVEYPASELLHCPTCEAVCPGYDHKTRRWRHLNTMQFKTFIEGKVPRTNCGEHGVHLIRIPWAEDKSRYTALFEAYAIDVLQAVRSKVQAEELTALSWDQVDLIMDRAVARGMERRKIERLKNCGIDEKSFGKGHNYASILHDLYIVIPPHIDGLTSSVVGVHGVGKKLQKQFAITAPYREDSSDQMTRPERPV